MTTLRAVASLALLFVAGLALAEGELKITKVRLSFGPVGPERKTNQMIPGDEMFVRYLVEGVKVGPDGKIEIKNRIVILNPEGKEIYDQEAVANEILALGGNAYHGVSTMGTGPGVAPGEYTVKVTTRDLLAKVDVTSENKIVVVKPRFGMARLRFSHDPEGKSNATTSGVVGEQIFFRLAALNFKREGGVHVIMETQVYDAANEVPVMPNPLTATVKVDKPEELEMVKKAVVFNGFVSLSRAGDFTLRIRVSDERGMNEERVDLPLKVRE